MTVNEQETSIKRDSLTREYDTLDKIDSYISQGRIGDAKLLLHVVMANNRAELSKLK